MKRAAEIRDDVVAKRMKSIAVGDEEATDSSMFVYHNTNKCYKFYTHSTLLKRIEKKRACVEDADMVCESENEASTSTSAGSRKTLRKSVVPCAPPSCDRDPKTLPCVICGNLKTKGCREKYRICEYDSAKKLIEAAKHYQDEVFTRIADRLGDSEGDCVKSVISADLYCHNICRQNLMRKYERDMKPEAS
ncbi:hypothetical protein ACOMHN_016767 [Nucella lapillus]